MIVSTLHDGTNCLKTTWRTPDGMEPLSRNITAFDRTQTDAPVMLVVGDLDGWRRAGRGVPSLPGCHFVGFADVTAATLARVAPDVVLSALFAADFDALELARRLADLGFRGRYRALAAGLPSPGVIRAEIAAAAAEVDFDLFLLDPTAFSALPPVSAPSRVRSQPD